MKVIIELQTGPNHSDIVEPGDVDKNIEALERALNGQMQGRDFILIQDTISILKAIKKALGQ
jgi:hypothetical protein